MASWVNGFVCNVGGRSRLSPFLALTLVVLSAIATNLPTRAQPGNVSCDRDQGNGCDRNPTPLIHPSSPANLQPPKPQPSSPSTDPPLHFPITVFHFQGNTVLSDRRLRRQLRSFLGEARTLRDLKAIQTAILTAYERAGYPLVRVNQPQRLTPDGAFSIEIVELTVGEVAIANNQHFSIQSIRIALPDLQTAQPPNIKQLTRQLFLANDNPSRQLTLHLHSPADGKIPVEIQVKDRFPHHWALQLDNSGIETTGRTRLSLTTQNHNLFNQGHLAAFSLTLSPEKIDRLLQLGFRYQLPIPHWGDSLSLSASYSKADSGRIADLFDVSGEGIASRLRFTHNLKRSQTDRHSLDIGLDYRLFQNRVDFFGLDLGNDVASFPISLGYQYASRQGPHHFALGVRYWHNLPGIVNQNNTTAYSNSRARASTNWDLIRLNSVYQRQWENGWGLNFQLEGQYAGEPLIPGEQFGLGGQRSIRGLEAREVAGDNALRASLELHTPNLGQGHRLLAFSDLGSYWREAALPGEIEHDVIWTVGLGWRWQLRDRATSTLDLGYVLDGSTISNPGDLRLHFLLQILF